MITKKGRMLLGASAIVLAAAGIIATPSPSFACGPESYIGTICTTAGAWCPRGTVETNGQVLQISLNQALFAVIGATYGGDGKATFAVPDLRGRAIVHYGQGPGLSPRNYGAKFGSETVTQTLAQMPVHTHKAQVAGSVSGKLYAWDGAGASTTPSAANNALATANGGPSKIYGTGAGNKVELKGLEIAGSAGAITVTNDNAGAGQPMPIIPPEIALRLCMVTGGLWPDRE